MSISYPLEAAIDAVSGLLDPLYYVTINTA